MLLRVQLDGATAWDLISLKIYKDTTLLGNSTVYATGNSETFILPLVVVEILKQPSNVERGTHREPDEVFNLMNSVFLFIDIN